MNETREQRQLHMQYINLVQKFDTRKEAQESIEVSRSDMQQKLSGTRYATQRDVYALKWALYLRGMGVTKSMFDHWIGDLQSLIDTLDDIKGI